MTPEFPVPDCAQCVRFVLSAEPSPGLFSRLLQPFARRDLIPDSVSASRRGSLMHVEIAAAIPSEMLPYVEGNLRQIVGLHGLTREIAEPLPAAA